MHTFNNIVNAIKLNLKNNLPGITAQQKMAPTLRGGFSFPASPNANTRGSAVLILIYPDHGIPKTILIRRTVYKGAHGGQVSFPGGKQEDFDKSILETALREAEEEIGINPKAIEIIGTLTPLFIPVSNLLVTPVVGIMPNPSILHLNLQEVEYTIASDILGFKDIENKSVKTICVGHLPISAPYYAVEKEIVWGATAMIISEFSELY